MSLVTQIEYKALSDIQQICKSHNTCVTCPFGKPNPNESYVDGCMTAAPPTQWDITKILDTLYNERTIKGV